MGTFRRTFAEKREDSRLDDPAWNVSARMEEVLDGKQVVEVIKLIGAFWLGAEAGARVPT